MQTLDDGTINLTRPRKVCHVDTGVVGYATTYGRPSFGGVRTAVFASLRDAKEADVSDDVGAKVLARGASGYRDWHKWQLI